MITLANLQKILDSIEQSTNNPNLKITFAIDHNYQSNYMEDNNPKDRVDTIQSVKIEQSISIDSDNPEPQVAPDAGVVITLE